MRCPNLRDPDARKEFNDIIERLGGRPIAEGDVATRDRYLKSLNPAEQRAYNLAHFYFDRHPTAKAAHAYLDAIDSARKALGSSEAPEKATTEAKPATPERAAALQRFADEAGWQEVGGKLLRDANGNVTGRTRWVPKAEWWPGREVKANAEAYRQAVKRYLAGERLSARDQRIVDSLNKLEDEGYQGGSGDVHGELMAAADAFGIPTQGLSRDEIQARVQDAQNVEQQLQETEADKEARLEREAIQGENLIPQEDEYAGIDWSEPGLGKGEGAARGGEQNPAQASEQEHLGQVAEGARGAQEADQGVGNSLAVKQRLFVEHGTKRAEVSSLEDAAQKWKEFRKATGAGASDLGSGRVVDQEGKEVARISYNGKVWPPGPWQSGMKPLVGENFRPSQASERPALEGGVDENESHLQRDLKGRIADQQAAVEHRRNEIAAFDKWHRDHPEYEPPPGASEEADRIDRYRKELPRAEQDLKKLKERLAAENERLQTKGAQFRLTGQTESQLAADERLKASREAEARAKENAPAPSEFTLTGSNRAADVAEAKGQKGLFSRRPTRDVTKSDAFKKWFGGSKVVDAKGKPLVVYHGTTGDFSEFDQARANPESDFGRGFYFTNTAEDVSENYAGEGPDLTSKIEREAERIFNERDGTEGLRYGSPKYIEAMKEAKDEARQQLGVEHRGAAMPVYLALKDPLVVGGPKGGSFLDYDYEYEPLSTFNKADVKELRDQGYDDDEIRRELSDRNRYEPQEKGKLVDFVAALRKVASRYDDGSVDDLVSEILNEGMDGGIRANRIYELANKDEHFGYYTDENGNLVSKEILRQAFQDAGYDGIIDHEVNKKFGSEKRIGKPMAGMHEGTVHYIAFEPNQIKSAIGNRGTFDPNNPDIRFSRAPGFYSELERQVSAKNPGNAPASVWRSYVDGLTKRGVKNDEIQWSGLRDWLDLKGNAKVTPQEVQEFLKGNGVQVHETQLGGNPQMPESYNMAKRALEQLGYTVEGDTVHKGRTLIESPSDAGEDSGLVQALYDASNEPMRDAETKFSQYTLPGGENYRELLLTLPESEHGKPEPLAELPEGYRTGVDHSQPPEQRYHVLPPGQVSARPFWGRHATPEKAEAEALDHLNYTRLNDWRASRPEFKSSHFDQPNILAHVRFNDRMDAEGRKVLFIEELQSDWAQKGKREGFKTAADEKRFAELNKEYEALAADRDPVTNVMRNEARWHRVTDEMNEINDRRRSGIPAAPFVGKTEAWVALSLKRMIRYAAENGYDRIAWTNGEQQASRYDLSKHIDRVVASRRNDGDFAIQAYTKSGGNVWPGANRMRISAATLADYVGKDLAEKIKKDAPPLGEGEGTWKGLDLKVGGEGMKAFYDKIVPNVANDVLKKLGGGRVERGVVPISRGPFYVMTNENQLTDTSTWPHFENYADAARVADEHPSGQIMDRAIGDVKVADVNGFDITPELRAKALEGQPLFARGEQGGEGRLAKPDVEKLIAPVLKNWENAPKVHVIESMDEAPGVMREMDKAQRSGGATGEPEAFIHGNDVYLVAKGLGSESDAMRALFHESFGHFGLRGVLGDRIVPVLEQVAKSMPERVAAKAEEYGLDMGKHEDRLQAAEEVLANIAETRPQAGFVQRAVAVIRAFFRKLGVPLKLTHNDIVSQFIVPARKMVEGGNIRRQAEGALSRERTGDNSSEREGTGPEDADSLRNRAAAAAEENEHRLAAKDAQGSVGKFSRAPAVPAEVEKPEEKKLNVVGRAGMKAAEYVHQSKVAQAYQSLFSPESVSENSMRADPIFAEYKASNRREKDVIEHKSDEQYRAWLKVPEKNRLEFLKRLETGNLPEEGRAAEMAKRYRKMLDSAYAEEALYGSKSNYVHDYLPHIWKDTDKAREFFGNLRQSLGPKWFQKARQFDLIEEGLKHGLELKTTNPEELVTMRLMASADMKAKMKLLHELEKEGIARPLEKPKGEVGEEGDVTQNLPVPRNWSQVVAPNGKAWAIHPDLNYIWKNAMDAPSLWSNQSLAGSAYRGWMQFKNVWVPIRLSVSLFHPVHILGINVAQALQESVIHALRGGDTTEALANLKRVTSINPKLGRTAREAWLKKPEEMTKQDKAIVTLMEMGGFVPQLSEELRIKASRSLAKALADKSKPGIAWHGLRRGIEYVQSAVFEKWIPNLKAASYLNEAKLLIKRDPSILNDEPRLRRELRTIAKSIDNRYGEMFYGGLFWNRTMRDLGTGSFLSLSWNYGFVREFGGGLVVDPAKLLARTVGGDKVLARDVSGKTVFSLAYVSTAMLTAGMLTWALSGHLPKKWLDWIFPDTGEKNPDGSEHRLSTPMFTREVPQLEKHVQASGGSWTRGMLDMLWNKTLFEPIKELWDNRSYYGYDITDPNGSIWQNTKELADWAATQQLTPMAVSQMNRTADAGGRAADYVLSFMGFGPAPSYAARTDTQNRIDYLYRRHVAPASRPLPEEARNRAKAALRVELERAVMSGNDVEANRAMDEAAKAGVSLKAMQSLRIPGDIIMFRGLPDSDQDAILKATNDDEFRRYAPFAHRDVKRLYVDRIQKLTQYNLKWGPGVPAR